MLEVVGWAHDVGHHEAVDGGVDEAGFGDLEGGGVGGGAGRELVDPGAAVGCVGDVE